MKFNWVTSVAPNPALKRICIDLEYRLRPKITKFLLSRLDNECCGDFSCFYFDVDLDKRWIWISAQTPEAFIEKIKVDFDREINGSRLFFSA